MARNPPPTRPMKAMSRVTTHAKLSTSMGGWRLPIRLSIATCAQASYPRIGPAKSSLQASSESARNLVGGLRGRNRQAPILAA